MKNSIFKKLALSGVCAVVILSAFSVIYSVSSAEKGAVDVSAVRIPEPFGIVKEVHKGINNKAVFHIQDAHCNFEAQDNNSKILRGLIDGLGIDVVAVEGSSGVIDTAPFSGYPNKKARDDVAAYFLQNGRLTGPEFLAITGEKKFTLFGIEDADLYKENYDLFIKSLKFKAAAKDSIKELRGIYLTLMQNMYGPELKGFNSKVLDYKDGKIKFTEFAKVLNEYADHLKININEYKNLALQRETQALEAGIDFDNVEKERAAIVDALSKKLSKDDLSSLVTKSLSFRLGRMTSDEYYAALKDYALKAGVDMKEYPNLSKYTDYLALFAKIDKEVLMGEAEKLEGAVKDKMFTDKDQRSLDTLAKDLDVLGKLFDLKLSINDYKHFREHAADFNSARFIDFAKKFAGKYGIFVPEAKNIPVIDDNIEVVEKFYDVATKRDGILVKNTLEKMDKEGVDRVVMVTGGFHTEGIREQLKAKGYSYMIITPRITKFDVESPYVDVMTGKETPLEAMLSGGTPETGTLAPSTPLQKKKYYPIFDRLAKEDAAIADAFAHKDPNGDIPPQYLAAVKQAFFDSYNEILTSRGEAAPTIADIEVVHKGIRDDGTVDDSIYFYVKKPRTPAGRVFFRITHKNNAGTSPFDGTLDLPDIISIAKEKNQIGDFIVQAYAPKDVIQPGILAYLERQSGPPPPAPSKVGAMGFGSALDDEREEFFADYLSKGKLLSPENIPASLKEKLGPVGGFIPSIWVVPSNSETADKNVMLLGNKKGFGVTYYVDNKPYFVLTEEAVRSLGEKADESLLSEITSAWKHELEEIGLLDKFDDLVKGGKAVPEDRAQYAKYAHLRGLIAQLDLKKGEAIPSNFVSDINELLAKSAIGKDIVATSFLHDLVENAAGKIEEIKANKFIAADPLVSFFAVNLARIINAYALSAAADMDAQAKMTDSLYEVMYEASRAAKNAAEIADDETRALAENFNVLAQRVFKREFMKDKVRPELLDYVGRYSFDIRAVRFPKSDEEKSEYLKSIDHNFLTAEEKRVVLEPGNFISDVEEARALGKRAILEGVIKPVVVICIKELADGDNFLNYYHDLMQFSRELNGNVTFILTVGDPKYWLHDGAGIINSYDRLSDFLGEKFMKESEICMIPDGGNKTRGLSLSIDFKAGQWNITSTQKMFHASFYDMMARRLMVPHRNNHFFMNGSDNVLKTVGVRIGKKSLDDIKPDENMVLFGFGADILTVSERKFLDVMLKSEMNDDQKRRFAVSNPTEQRLILKEVVDAILDGKEKEKDFFNKIAVQLKNSLDKVREEKLVQLGTFTTRSEDDVINAFLEKARAMLNLMQIYLSGSDSINKNLFVFTMNKDFIEEMIDYAKAHPLPGNVLAFEGGYSFFKAFSMALLTGDEYEKELFDRAKEFNAIEVYSKEIKKTEEELRSKKDTRDVKSRYKKVQADILKKSPDLSKEPEKLEKKTWETLALNTWAEKLAADENFRGYFELLRKNIGVTRGATILPEVKVTDAKGNEILKKGKWLDAGDVTSDFAIVEEAYSTPEFITHFEGRQNDYELLNDSTVVFPSKPETVFLDGVAIAGGMKLKLSPDTIIKNCLFKGSVGKVLDLPPGEYENCLIDLDYGAVKFENRGERFFVSNLFLDRDIDVLPYGTDINIPEPTAITEITLRGGELYRQHIVRNARGVWVTIPTRVPIEHDPKGFSIRDNIVSDNKINNLYAVLKEKKRPASIDEFSSFTIDDLVDQVPELLNSLIDVFPELIYDEVMKSLKEDERMSLDEFASVLKNREKEKKEGGYKEWWLDHVWPQIMEKFKSGTDLRTKQNIGDVLVDIYKGKHKEIFTQLNPDVKKSWYENQMIKGYKLEQMQAISKGSALNERIEDLRYAIRQLIISKRPGLPAPPEITAPRAPVPIKVHPPLKNIELKNIGNVWPILDPAKVIEDPFTLYFSMQTLKNAVPAEVKDAVVRNSVQFKLHIVEGDKFVHDIPIPRKQIFNLADRNPQTKKYDGVSDPDVVGLKRFEMKVRPKALGRILSEKAIEEGYAPGEYTVKIKPMVSLDGEKWEYIELFEGRISPDNKFGDIVLKVKIGPKVPPIHEGGEIPSSVQARIDRFFYGLPAGVVPEGKSNGVDVISRGLEEAVGGDSRSLEFALSYAAQRIDEKGDMVYAGDKYLPALIAAINMLGNKDREELLTSVLPPYIAAHPGKPEARVAQAAVEFIGLTKNIAAKGKDTSINISTGDVIVAGEKDPLPLAKEIKEAVGDKNQEITGFDIKSKLSDERTVTGLFTELMARKFILDNDPALVKLREWIKTLKGDKLAIPLSLIAETVANDKGEVITIRNRGAGFAKVLKELLASNVKVTIMSKHDETMIQEIIAKSEGIADIKALGKGLVTLMGNVEDAGQALKIDENLAKARWLLDASDKKYADNRAVMDARQIKYLVGAPGVSIGALIAVIMTAADPAKDADVLKALEAMGLKDYLVGEYKNKEIPPVKQTESILIFLSVYGRSIEIAA